jgi:hypothetical protein
MESSTPRDKPRATKDFGDVNLVIRVDDLHDRIHILNVVTHGTELNKSPPWLRVREANILSLNH